jgi:amino acid adenylation domain-containing protein
VSTGPQTATGLLAHLRALGAGVTAEAGKLRYSAPPGVVTAELRAEMARRKEELLALLEAEHPGPVLGALPRPADLPLSFAQVRLWFLHQLAPETALYNSTHAFLLRGPLRADVLAAALGEVVRRHEALRTTFVLRGTVVQLIAPPGAFTVPLVDVRGIAVSDPARFAAGFARRAVPSLDLERGPLVHAFLLRTAGEEHILLFLVPHILSDGWSTGVVVGETARLYEALAAGRSSPLPAPLPALPFQYPDFALWERAVLQDEALAEPLRWWRERLAGAPEVLALPADRPRPAVQTFSGARLPVAVPEPAAAVFKAFARRQGATLFLASLAVFDRLLAAWSGEDDIVMGTPVTGRRHRGLEGLVGCFVNTVVLRTAVRGEESAHALVARVRETASGAFTHQEVPFERLVAELRPERDAAHPPLVQVMFTVRVPAPPVILPGLEVVLLETSTGSDIALVDLVLELSDETAEGRGFGGFLEYNPDLFDRSTMARLASHLGRLVAGFAARPDDALSVLPLLSAAEEHQLLAEWNDTVRIWEEDGPATLHGLFAAQAARTPEAVAVLGAGEVLTYRGLEERAGRLARCLRERGVGPGVTVGVCLDRSAEMVVAVLAVLAAGGAYVPLDGALPRERLAGMLADAGARVLISRGDFPWRPEEVRSVDLEADAGTIAARSVGWPRGGAAPDHLAYIIYTSGSTGRPKGVLVRHAAAVNLIRWVNGRFGVGPADRVLFVTSLGFDLSVYDIFGLLAAGGSVRVATSAELRDPEALVRSLTADDITFWDSAPAALQRLVPFLEPHPLTPSPIAPPATGRGGTPSGAHPLRLVFLSGDWIPVRLPEEIRAAFPAARVVALGGATEATVWSNFFPVDPERGVDPAWPSIPYGRPIANARYHVLDPWLRPCPLGVAGDLCIGGACLAAGYAAAPELTAAKFIPDPFAAEPGARLYRTGDRARHLADGNLEFLGRLDTQVKVRGFRIELGEIEAALAAHPAVRDAAALVQGEVGDRRLLAFWVPGTEETHLDARELRAWLKERLPEPMVPAFFLRLDALPVTANGKLDRAVLVRKAAEERDAAPRAEEGGFAAPRTPAEELLAAIWSEILGVPRVGVHDNFFELGGDSILSIQVVARAQRAGLALTARDLFRRQTVAELAVAAGGASPRPEAVPGQALAEDLYPLSPLQRGLLFHALWEPFNY